MTESKPNTASASVPAEQKPVPARPTSRNIRKIPSGPRPPDRGDLKRLATLLSGPPLLPAEKIKNYEQLSELIFATIRPGDMIELLWTKDIVDAAMEVERLKKLRAALIRGAYHEQAINFFERREKVELGVTVSRRTIAEQRFDYHVGVDKNDEHLTSILTNEAAFPDIMLANCFRQNMETLEKFDSMLAAAERRRDRAIWQIEEYRNRGEKARRAPPTIDL